MIHDKTDTDHWILMPDHFHGIIINQDNFGRNRRCGSRTDPTLGIYKPKPLRRGINGENQQENL